MFGLEIAQRPSAHRFWRGLTWHVDETYMRVGGTRCYLWRALDHCGQTVDFRLMARCDAKAFLGQAKVKTRLYQPMMVVTDNAPTYAFVIGEMNKRNFSDDPIMHVDRIGGTTSSSLIILH